MNYQCNTCGRFDKLDVCTHCTTVVCERCKMGHAPLCEELKKRKRRGEGPTIANVPMPPHRSGHETPPTTGPDRRPLSFIPPEAYDAVNAVLIRAEAKYTEGIEHLDAPVAPESNVDIGLMGVADLLNEE